MFRDYFEPKRARKRASNTLKSFGDISRHQRPRDEESLTLEAMLADLRMDHRELM